MISDNIHEVDTHADSILSLSAGNRKLTKLAQEAKRLVGQAKEFHLKGQNDGANAALGEAAAHLRNAATHMEYNGSKDHEVLQIGTIGETNLVHDDTARQMTEGLNNNVR